MRSPPGFLNFQSFNPTFRQDAGLTPALFLCVRSIHTAEYLINEQGGMNEASLIKEKLCPMYLFNKVKKCELLGGAKSQKSISKAAHLLGS